jgi:hypothetical protein
MAEALDLGLSDEDYWASPFKTRGNVESKLMSAGTEALIIGAPKAVILQNRDTLPVVVIRTAPLDIMARTVFRKTAVLVAVDVTTNKTYAYMAIVIDIKEPAPYNGPPLEGMGGEAFLLELKKQLKLPWVPSTYMINILLRDKVSNRARVEIKKGGYEDPAVIEFLKSRQKTVEAPSVWPEPGPPTMGPQGIQRVGIPYYRELTTAPPIPAQPGIVMAADRVVPMTPNMACLLRGSYRLPIQAKDIVKELPAQKPDMEKPHTAVVPITLVLTGSDSPAPIVVSLRVPTYDPVDKNAEAPVVTGQFTIDLCKLGNIAGLEQTLFIYAFSGDVMAGPVPMALLRQ